MTCDFGGGILELSIIILHYFRNVSIKTAITTFVFYDTVSRIEIALYFFPPFYMAKATPVKPFRTYRVGNLSLTIWRNERESKDGKSFTTFSANVQRSYKDESGEYKNTDSLGIADLVVTSRLCERAFDDLSGLQNGLDSNLEPLPM